jgi:tRNA A-37 threonylcarbamoyl transferase component Bud32
MSAPFPRLRLREPSPELLELPWELPLEDWPAVRLHFRDLKVGPSRHLVRFLVTDHGLVALKEEPADIAEREYGILRHLEEAGLPAVTPMGVAVNPDRKAAILVTRYLPNSLQYRRLLSRVPPGPSYLREQLLDAMAGLLVELHRGGVYWGDCSLANTLFRRDGNKVQAFLVDAETSERHPALSDGQRAYDLEVLVENVAFGLADLAEMHGRPDLLDDALAAAESVRDRYRALWDELHAEVEVGVDERFAMAARVRRLNELGFAVDEIELEPGDAGRVRMRVCVTNRRFHAGELERLTGLKALEGQARLLLNDLHEYGAWLERAERRSLPVGEMANRWLAEVYEPTLARLAPVVGPGGDAVQAYCDVLESKWLRSEKARRDIGLQAAIEGYLTGGTVGPELSGAQRIPA